MLNQAKKQPQKQEVPPLKWERDERPGSPPPGTWRESCLASNLSSTRQGGSEHSVGQGRSPGPPVVPRCGTRSSALTLHLWARLLRLGGVGSKSSPLSVRLPSLVLSPFFLSLVSVREFLPISLALLVKTYGSGKAAEHIGVLNWRSVCGCDTH